MPVRTLIEITADDHWKHAEDLRQALDKLGFEPKQDATSACYQADVWRALHENGIDPHKLVEEMRKREGR